ncbi:MAG: T9SS type A sorting domain-containing protein [Bacteroidota bacterium]
MAKKIYTLLFALCLFSGLTAQTVVTITDGDLQGGQTYNWTKDNIYLLDGFVYLEEDGVLNIEAGTVIKGKETPSNTDLASTLIIARGAQIFAEGTAKDPIIFTAEQDDTNDPDDGFGSNVRGLWGGLIVLGKGVLGDRTSEVVVEGLPEMEPRALYGGNDDEDNSGVIRYVSIRHGGAALAPGNEINGLTLGAVGSKTTIEFVEVFANFDDGIEWFGGTVSVKYAAVSFCGDDSYDFDTGWRGNGQFWFSLQAGNTGDNAGEHDGAKPDDNARFSQPEIYNATYIGGGVNGTGKNEHVLLFRDGTGGTYANSIFTDFTNFAIQVEDLPAGSGLDSRQRMENGELVVKNNIWFGFGEGSELNAGNNGIIEVTRDDDGNVIAEDATAAFLVSHLTNNGNTLEDPKITKITRGSGEELDPRPAVNGPAYEGLADIPEKDFFQEVPFKGAFGATNWLRGWTALDNNGFFADQDEIVVTDADLQGGQTYTWTNDNIYLLDGFVYLEDEGVLNIEPGTIIKGKQTPSTNELASTLIITRGAQIFAEGTAQAPIIFTTEIDDTDDPDDLPTSARGLWGGLIILGEGVLGDRTSEVVVEGLPEMESRALYGGNNDADNSGSLRYVSIRHGGAALAPGNEINGLTLGGVGSGTKIEYVEVFANFDDGIEWFGGTVSIKYAAVSYCGDDSYDYDTGWRGKGQFWLSLQASNTGDNGGEHDGAKPDDNARFSQPEIYNATYIGSGVDGTAKNEHALLFRDGTGATYGNSIFTDFANFAIQVEDLPAASGLDSRQRMLNGELSLPNNIWFGFGEGDQLNAGNDGIIQVTKDDNDVVIAEDAAAQFLIDHLGSNGNTIENPQLGGISRITDGGFDPRPAENGPAYTGNAAATPDDDFFSEATFRGAFCNDGVWIKDWTALSEYGVLNSSVPSAAGTCDIVNIDELFVEDNGYVLMQNAPNPAANELSISYVLPETAWVSMELRDINGRLIGSMMTPQRQVAGTHNLTYNVSELPNGFYFYTLRTDKVNITKRMVVSH